MLLLASAHFYTSRRTARILALSLALLFAIFAGLQAILDVAWSEDFRKFTELHEFIETYRGEAAICAIASIALVARLVNRKLAIFILALELSLGVMAFWPPPPAPIARLLTYSDGSSSFFAIMPTIHNTPKLVVALFTAGCVLGAVITAGHYMTRKEVLSFFLCVPLVAVYATWVGHYRGPYFPLSFPYELQVRLLAASLGLLGIARSVLQRTGPENKWSGARIA
jgi:hypothetical protein